MGLITYYLYFLEGLICDQPSVTAPLAKVFSLPSEQHSMAKIGYMQG